MKKNLFKKNKNYCEKKIFNFDYKKINFIKKFVNISGKIIPSKVSKINLYYQRKISLAIKHYRFLCFLPYVCSHIL